MRRLWDRLDTRYARICLYAAVTTLATLAAGMVLYFSSGFFVQLWLLVCAVLEPAVYGMLIAYLLNPLVARVSHALRRVGWLAERGRLRRQAGVVACVLALAALLACLVLLMVVVITRSVSSISFERLMELWQNARADIERLAGSLEGYLGGEGTSTEGGGTDLIAWVGNLFQGAKDMASTALFSVIFAVYLLMDGERVGDYCLRVARATLGERVTARLLRLVDDADHVFSGYIHGQFIDALVVGVLSAVALTLAGVPYGPVIALLTGLGNLIPYVGAPLGIGTTVLVCMMEDQYEKMAVGIALLALIMFVDSNVINPKLLSDNVEVHPLLVIAALIAGGAVGGLAGMLVAVPAAALLKMQLDRWLVAREHVSDACVNNSETAP